jgi:hypothetical protein
MKKLSLTAILLAGIVSLLAGTEPWEKTHTGRFAFEQGIVLEYEVVPFDKGAFRRNDGRIGPVYGVDGGGAPLTKLKKLVLIRQDSRTPLEVSCMYEPALGGMEKRQFSLRVISPRSVMLSGVFSDAAGSYAAQWLVVDGIGVRTLLSDDPDTVSRLVKP